MGDGTNENTIESVKRSMRRIVILLYCYIVCMHESRSVASYQYNNMTI